MKYLLIVLIVCLAVSFNKVQSNENVGEDDASQNELDNIQKEELDAIDGNAEDHNALSNLNCNFENGTCGWVNDNSSDFDWTRRTGSTPSSNTGPSGDHTPGLNGNGWYVYTEASSPRRRGDVARLVSAGYLRLGTYCLGFWYHMYGSSMGQMDVFTNGRNSSLFSVSGNQGNRWINHTVTFTRYSSFKIVFKGTTGSSYESDIALDDITVSRGNCGGPTTAPPRPTTASCFCYNGGYAYCRNGRLQRCYCYRGYYGSRCQYAPTPTRRPFTSSSCFCYNGGSPYCRNGRLQRCYCYRGYYGSRCQYGPRTTRRPFTTPRPLTCYRCNTYSSPRQCLIKTSSCYGSSSVCAYGRYTLKKDGRSYYYASCASSLNQCQSLCRNAFRQGIVTACSIRCCQRDYCNRINLYTTRRPPTRHTPTINAKFFLRLILKLLKSFKALIDVTSALLKAHLKSNDVQFKKREIVSMMKRVDYTAQNLENSRDPEVIQVKRDVDETRMRAKDLIAKLDDYIDDEPDKNKNKK